MNILETTSPLPPTCRMGPPSESRVRGTGDVLLGVWMNISRKWTRAMSAKDLPSGPGVYAFKCDGILLYVGCSVRLRKRIRTHHLWYGAGGTRPHIHVVSWNPLVGVEIWYSESTKLGDWLMREYRLLTRCQTAYNAPSHHFVDYYSGVRLGR